MELHRHLTERHHLPLHLRMERHHPPTMERHHRPAMERCPPPLLRRPMGHHRLLLPTDRLHQPMGLRHHLPMGHLLDTDLLVATDLL